MKYDVNVASFGDNAVDMYIHTNIQYPGGSCANFAVYAKMFGAKGSAYMGYFGSDRNAKQMINALIDNQIELVKCKEIEGENGYTKCVLEGGDRVFLGSNRGGVRGTTPYVLDCFDIMYLRNFDLVHSGIYGFNENELHKIHRAGIPLSFDFSDVADDTYYKKITPNIDYAFCSFNADEEEVKEHLRKIVAMGPKLVCASRGAEGCILYDGKSFYKQSAVSIKNVIDTMGAGDSLIASFMVGYLASLKKGTANETTIRESIENASIFASTICQLSGAYGYGQPIK